MARAGQFNRRIQIQKPVTTTDAEGTESVVWTTVISTWASVDYLQGRERMEAEQLQNPRTVTITIRNQPAIAITAAMRVVYGSRTFEITSAIPDEEPPRVLTLSGQELHP